MVNPMYTSTVPLKSRESKKVVVVNGTADIMEMLETVLDPGQYDVMFVESGARAYTHIKRASPQLVILCMRIEDLEGFQVLSMLKLDDETLRIPVLTYTTEFEGQELDQELDNLTGEPLQPARALPMN